MTKPVEQDTEAVEPGYEEAWAGEIRRRVDAALADEDDSEGETWERVRAEVLDPLLINKKSA